jgi:hypothetical protein
MLLLFGIFVVPYLRKTKFKTTGLFLGACSLVSGITGLTVSNIGIDGIVYQSIWIALAFSLVTASWLAFRTPRALIFLPLPLYLLTRLFFPSVPLLVFLTALALEAGILKAYDFSRVDITRIPIANPKTSGLLSLFLKLGSLSKQMIHDQWSKSLALLVYSSVSIAIVAIALAIWLISGTTIGSDILVVAWTIYLVLASREFLRRFPAP